MTKTPSSESPSREPRGTSTASIHAGPAQQVAFLRVGLGVLAAGCVALTLVLLWAGQAWRVWLVLPIGSVALAMWCLLLAGRHEAAFRVAVFGFWAATLLALSLVNGVHGPSVSFLIVLLLVSGWMVSVRAAVFLTVVTPLAMFALAWAMSSGRPFPVLSPTTPFYAAIVHSAALVGAGLLGYYGGHTFALQLRQLERSRDDLLAGVVMLEAHEEDLRRTRDDLAVLNTNLETIVAERTSRLKTAMQDMESFSYSVSHDLRAPLRAVSGYLAELVETVPAVTADGGQFVAAIERNTRHMAALIDGLLELSRVDRAELRKATVDLRALLAEVLGEMMRPHPRAKVQIGEMPPATADPTLLRQVFANLLGNALKYSSRMESPLVEVGWSSSDGAWFVRDNGVGFDPAQSARLFGTFERLPTARDFEGTGVGLALVKKIVERHGGRVWADSQPDRGATFYFTLGA